MDFFTKRPREGGYLFLSHSHADIHIVRKIRNALEEDGFEPLCFFLKCLDDDDEIEGLIKREIDAREWFLFLDSENARASRWVQMERDYISRDPGKKVLRVDLADLASIERALRKVRLNLRVFLSYSRRDMGVAMMISERLEERDYMVIDSESAPLGQPTVLENESAILEASRDGCVLLLLTEGSVGSQAVKMEALTALRQGGNIIPVVLGAPPLDRDWEVLLAHTRYFTLPLEPTAEEVDRMIEDMGRAILAH